jgi:hypothetical protein
MSVRTLVVLLWMVPLEGSAHPAEGHVLESLEQAVEEEPENIQLRQRRADLRVFEGDVEGAFEDLAVALVLAPENPSVLRQQALLMERTNHPGAEQALAAAAIEGRDPDIFFRLGRLREGKGDTSGACDAWGAGMARLGAGILQESADRLGCASVLVHAERESTVSHAPPSPLPAVLDRIPTCRTPVLPAVPSCGARTWRVRGKCAGERRLASSTTPPQVRSPLGSMKCR